MTNKEIKQNMTDNLGDILEFVNEYDYKIHEESWGIGVFINGIKLEWNIPGMCIKMGYGNDKDQDLPAISEWLESNGYEVNLTPKGGLSKICFNPTVDDFKEVFELVESHDIQLVNPQGVYTQKEIKLQGVSFAGTLLSRTKERGASIQSATSKLVCEAANMNADMLFAEQHFSNGQIDGIEYNPDGTVKSIYEVQSGIFNGDYLDANHRDKALGRYLYDPEIISTVEKVVIWAGGYYDSDLLFIKERSIELSRRDNPIDIVLLKTVKSDNVYGIDVEVVDYK